MDWLHKIRTTWTTLSTRIKLRKSAAGIIGGSRSRGELSGDSGGAVSGLLNLRDDVKMCGYRDVEVMWNMLSSSLTTESMETARSTKRKKLSQRNCKQRSNSRLLFWSNHNP